MGARSLFARLFWMQAAIVGLLVLLFFLLFYVERNLTVARLLADRWAPALRSAAPAGAEVEAAVLQSAGLPPNARVVPGFAPRLAALRSALLEAGVPVQALALESRGERSLVWVAVPQAQGPQRWLGFDDHRLIEPDALRRLLLAAGLVFVLVGSLCWLFARRLTQPLDRLRRRLLAHRPGQPSSEPEPPPANASAEMLAIHAAWHEMRARLARHEHERGLMLAGVSHDLRSPLARIRMAAELLPDDPTTAPRRDAIVRNVQVADRLLEGFLDHARLAALPLDTEVDLAAAARHAAAGREGVQVQADEAVALHNAHPLLVERILANLLDNALQHGQAPVQLIVRAEPQRLLVEVRDQGAGIAPALQALMLEAFARGDSARGTPGSGLGLAIVRDGVERLGGRVEFLQGTAGGFVVRLCWPR